MEDLTLIEQRLRDVEGLVEDLVHRIEQTEGQQEQILKGIQELQGGMQEILDLWTNAKGFATVLGWVGFTMKWLVVTGSAAAAIWAVVTGKVKL